LSSKDELIQALRPEDQTPQVQALADMLAGAGIENLHPALKKWVFETDFGPMIKHPFVYMMLGGSNALLVQNANKMYAAKIQCRRDYLDRGQWDQYLWAHERPYRMHVLAKLYERDRISHAQLCELLPTFWIDCEMPQSNQEEPLHLFREAGFVTDDEEGWKKLAAKKWFKLYRGVDYKYELTKDGPSWTRSLATAKFFAGRYGAGGDVFEYRATPDEVLAWLTSRDETECILDFDGESSREKIRKVEL